MSDPSINLNLAGQYQIKNISPKSTPNTNNSEENNVFQDIKNENRDKTVDYNEAINVISEALDNNENKNDDVVKSGLIEFFGSMLDSIKKESLE